LKWWAQLTAESVGYRVEHLRSAAMKLSDGWYGSDGMKVYMASEVSIQPDSLTIIREMQNSTRSIQVSAQQHAAAPFPLQRALWNVSKVLRMFSKWIFCLCDRVATQVFLSSACMECRRCNSK
jgi:hypothetical protein